MSKGRFGIHGGQYIPETLMNAVIELEKAYDHYKNDPAFNRELTALLDGYAGRPSRLTLAGGVARPCLLAGGLTPENIPGAVTQLRPYGLDISSGVETDKRKDFDKIQAAVTAARKD